MKEIALFFGLILLASLHAQQVDLFPTYHSIGIKVTNISSIDSCTVEYKKSNQAIWLKGFNPDKITISTIDQFRGSLFLLEESTSYDIRIKPYKGGNEMVLSTLQKTTVSSPEFTSTTTQKWVSPNGSGNLFSQANPGNINTLFSSGLVSCGTTVLLMDGNYSFTEGLALSLNNHCSESSPIILMAAPGAKPVIDGGQKITTNWTAHSTIPHLYSNAMPTNAAHSNICIMGNKGLYPYPSVVAEDVLGKYNLSDLNFDYDGFVRDENVIWIKTKEGINPNSEDVIVSKCFRFLTVYGNNKNAFLKVKGISFKYFGKPILNALGSAQDDYAAAVFDLRNVHHVYFDSCNFTYNTNHIVFSNQCDHNTIQHCNFKHDVGTWSHAMIKKSHDKVHTLINTISSSRARGVESPAIFMDQCKQTVIRYNYFDGLNSGIESYFDTGFNEEIDIYNNAFIDNFDAVECDGQWSNLRVWKNEIIRPMAGISAAPPLIGPRYFYRNTIHGMKGRVNEKDDPYFVACNPVGTNYRGQGIGIKTNSAYEGNIPRGNLYFFNNTFHAEDTLGFVFTSWTSEWKKAVFINNAYSHQYSHPFFYFDLGKQSSNSDFQISSRNDNYFSYNTASPIVVADRIHGQFDCTDIYDVNKLEDNLQSISASPNIDIQNPMQTDPSFINKTIGGFELDKGSILIDKGQIIPGFHDYFGLSPDIGAKESNYTVSVKETSTDKQLIVYPNPTNGQAIIVSYRHLKNASIKIYTITGQIIFTANNFFGSRIDIDVSQLLSGMYVLEVKEDGWQVRLKLVRR